MKRVDPPASKDEAPVAKDQAPARKLTDQELEATAGGTAVEYAALLALIRVIQMPW